MTQNTKAFSKETEELERQLHQLTRNKYELKMDLKKEQQELRKLEKQFLETGDAADGLKMALQGQAVDHVRRNLDLVTASARKAEKRLRGVGTETSKLQNRASGIVNALGSSGTAQTIGLVGGMGLQSAFGTEKASMISQVISSTASGALFGASLMGPIGAVAGATIGAGAGALMSYAERKESQQNALQDYIQTNLENTGAHFDTLAEGGIAIVRLSGKDCVKTIAQLFRVRGKTLADLEARVLHLGTFSYDGVRDVCLGVRFEAPCSFTGEDVVELHLHGGVRLAMHAVEACIACGARLARPGEFTQRAFLNGKMTLAQAGDLGKLRCGAARIVCTLKRRAERTDRLDLGRAGRSHQ